MQSSRLSLTPVFPLFASLFFREGEDGDDTDSTNQSSTGGAEGGSEQGKKSSESTEGDPQKKISAQQEEIERHVRLRKAAEEERDQLKAKTEEYERKNRSAEENLNKDLEELKASNATLLETNRKLSRENAFLKDNSYKWHSPEDALALADLSEVEFNDDGTVKDQSKLRAALKTLADNKKYLLASEADDGEPGKQTPPPATGQPPRGKNGSSEDSKAKQSEKLRQKYPALRSHY